MNKLTLILVLLLSLSNIIYSFWGNQESDQIFGIEMNIWIYRLVWIFVIIGISYDYFKKKKTE
ncbi:hypothetical protein [uncultured Formosa sp.]|uniref:hypothetical protein n=1 Tax=uncultured Formosa sp. TaxID=255435 RepID=UPI002606892C|nr:hypothetical protein [uncultured Formosa sp.]